MTMNLVRSDKISTRPYGDGVSELHCPNCGFAGLHHREVRSYDRKEDATSITKTSVAGGRVSVQPDHDGSGNPSSRRDGIVISFDCEGCDASPIELNLAQHKGSTEIGWVYGKPD